MSIFISGNADHLSLINNSLHNPGQLRNLILNCKCRTSPHRYRARGTRHGGVGVGSRKVTNPPRLQVSPRLQPRTIPTNLRMIINCNNSVGCNSLWGYNLGVGDVLLRVIRIRTWRLDCTLTFCSIDCYNLIHLLIVHSSLDVGYFNHRKTNDAGTGNGSR